MKYRLEDSNQPTLQFSTMLYSSSSLLGKSEMQLRSYFSQWTGCGGVLSQETSTQLV